VQYGIWDRIFIKFVASRASFHVEDNLQTPAHSFTNGMWGGRLRLMYLFWAAFRRRAQQRRERSLDAPSNPQGLTSLLGEHQGKGFAPTISALLAQVEQLHGGQLGLRREIATAQARRWCAGA
jgi:hypothetical protein